MPTREELEKAIAETELQPSSMQTCEKLHILYDLYDRLYAGPEQAKFVHTKRDNELSELLDGTPVEDAVNVFEELLEALEIYNPRLYNDTCERILEIKEKKTGV